MPYIIAAAIGGLLTLGGLRGCEKAIETMTGEPPKPMAPGNEKWKYIFGFGVGAGAVVGAIYITKKLLK